MSNCSAKLRTAVVDKASALRTSVRRTSMHPPALLSVRQAWSKIGHSLWQGQLRAATNPRSGHNGDSRGARDYRREDGGSGGDGGHGGGSGNGGGGDFHNRRGGNGGGKGGTPGGGSGSRTRPTLDEVAGAVAAALGEAAVVDETARGVVPLVTVPLSARPRLQARTAARPQ